MEYGVIHSVEVAVIVIAIIPTVRIGATTLRLEMPLARMAVISPSADMRFKVINTPARTPSGMVKLNVNGTSRAKSCATVFGGAELRTRVSNSLPTRCRKRTNVKRMVPRTELVTTSLKMDRLRTRIAYFDDS